MALFFMINFNWWGWLFGLLVTGAITFIPLDYFVFPNLIDNSFNKILRALTLY